MVWVAGVDACPAGWFVVLAEVRGGLPAASECFVCASFREVLRLKETRDVAAVSVDMPIGLLDVPRPGGRECDRLARKRIPGRTSCIFSPPTRGQLGVGEFAAARQLGPLTIQAWGILPKIREIDDTMSPALQDVICEAHPEVAFAVLNGGRPVQPGKKTAQGRVARLGVLGGLFPGLPGVLVAEVRNGVGRDDVLDAYAVAWTACRIVCGQAERIPAEPQVDGKGLRMQIWC